MSKFNQMYKEVVGEGRYSVRSVDDAVATIRDAAEAIQFLSWSDHRKLGLSKETHAKLKQVVQLLADIDDELPVTGSELKGWSSDPQAN